MELLGRYSNWTSWTDRLPATDKPGELRRESRSRTRRTARRLSEGDVTELVTRYQEGATVYELAKRFTIHRATVSGHLQRRGVRIRGLSLDQRQMDEAIRLYEQGWSVARIGRHVGVDGSTVWRAHRARGVRMRDTHEGISRKEGPRHPPVPPETPSVGQGELTPSSYFTQLGGMWMRDLDLGAKVGPSARAPWRGFGAASECQDRRRPDNACAVGIMPEW